MPSNFTFRIPLAIPSWPGPSVFDERWFEQADVNTCIVILERCDDEQERNDNLVRFSLLKKPLRYFIPIENLRRTILGHTDFYENDELRIYPKQQGELLCAGSKWGKYIRAPKVFFSILQENQPLFVELRTFGLLNTYLGALLPTFASAFGIFLLRQAMNQVPRELDEAATLDGAGHFRVFWGVILPNIRPALATLTVFAFMGSWNSFLWPLVVLRKPELQTLPIALAGLQGQYTTDWDVVMAGSVISILPMLALYLFAQKYVIQGVANSGIK